MVAWSARSWTSPDLSTNKENDMAVPKNDLPAAIAAAREASAALDDAIASDQDENYQARVDDARERCVNALDDLLAALDAARKT